MGRGLEAATRIEKLVREGRPLNAALDIAAKEFPDVPIWYSILISDVLYYGGNDKGRKRA